MEFHLSFLTNTIADLKNYVPDKNFIWHNNNIEMLSPIPTLLYKQSIALIHAFCGTQYSLPEFENGIFLKDKTKEQYLFLKEKLAEIYPKHMLPKHFNINDIIEIWKALIQTKNKVLKLQNIYSNKLLTAPIIYSYYQSEVEHYTLGLLKKLDELIEELCNSKRKTFSEEELISEYNYPTEDLNKLIIDSL